MRSAMPININVKIPGEKLAIKVWQSLVDNGIAGLFRPEHIRREGRAETDVEVERKLLLAQTEKEIEEIRNGRKVVVMDAAGKYLALPAPKAAAALPAPQCPASSADDLA